MCTFVENLHGNIIGMTFIVLKISICGHEYNFSEENYLLSLDKPNGKLLICIENDSFKKIKTWPSSKYILGGSHVLGNEKKNRFEAD